MTVQDVLREAQKLSLDERRELVKALVDTLAEETKMPKHSIMELAGLGAEIWRGIDAQEYVNQLRSEWDHRP